MIVTRFAPSPTGYLHLGHVHSALHGWTRARRSGGRFLLRIEDIDPVRCRPEYTAAILEDLRWLGLDWDGAVRVQSEHFGAYRRALDVLSARGLLYPCFCTRTDIAREVAASAHAPHGPDGPLYPGTCRGLTTAQRDERIASGIPYALRLDMAAALRAVPGPIFFTEEDEGAQRCDPAQFGDAVLARKDTPASYHLCVTHDDALQGITHVTRGEDLRPATHLHRLLQELMGWPAPVYAHHALLRGPDGKRLAKRDGATCIRDLRAAGASAADLRTRAGFPSV